MRPCYLPFLLLCVGLAAAPARAQAPCTIDVGPVLTQGNPRYDNISDAAAVATAGAVVCIQDGTYPETVKPRFGGTDTSPITYRANNPGNVVVTGADEIPWQEWACTQSLTPQGTCPGSEWVWEWTPQADWETTVSQNVAWFPFTYSVDISNVSAYTGPQHVQRRELLIARTGQPINGTAAAARYDGHLMRPVNSRAALSSTLSDPAAGVYGTYYVEPLQPGTPPDNAYGSAPARIYARFYNGATPQTARPMIAARRRAFAPIYDERPPYTSELGCGEDFTPGYLRVEGIVFRHTNNPEQQGAVCPGDLGAVFEDVAVEFTNGLGIGTGNYDPNQPGTDQTGSDHTFRRVRLVANGQMGIGGECDRCLLVDSDVQYNNWKGYNFRWEAGGMKFSYSTGTTIRRVRSWFNRGPGIWFDINNTANTIEGNWVRGNDDVGIFVELFSDETLVQHNVVTGTRRAPKISQDPTDDGTTDSRGGSGILVQVSRRAQIFHNTVLNNQGTGIFLNAFDDRVPQGWIGSDAALVNNVVVENATLPQAPDAAVSSAHEVNIEEATLSAVRTNDFAGNLYELHLGDVQLQEAFFVFRSAENVATATDDRTVWEGLVANAGQGEAYRDFNMAQFGMLGEFGQWPLWTDRLNLELDPNAQPVQLPTDIRSGHCYSYRGAYPDAVLLERFLDNPPPPSTNCGAPQTPRFQTITANRTLSAADNAYLAGKDTYIMPGVTVTVAAGAIVTLSEANGFPAHLVVLGTLNAPAGTSVVANGQNEVVVGPTGVYNVGGTLTLTGTGACVMVQAGGRLNLTGSLTATQGGLIASLGGLVALGPNATLIVTETAGASVVLPGSRFEMGTNARIEFRNPVDLDGTAEAPIQFVRAPGAGAWASVQFHGANSNVSHALFDGGATGVEIRAAGVELRNVTVRGGTVGIRTYTNAANKRSRLTLVDSRVVGASSIGVRAFDANVRIWNSEIDDNHNTGLYLFNASAEMNWARVTNNGWMGVYVGPNSVLSGDGTYPGGDRGHNRIANNVGHQIYVASSATAFLGLSDGDADRNAIVAGPATWSTSRLVYNASRSTVFASRNFWGDTGWSGGTPNASWFCNSYVSPQYGDCGDVDYSGWLGTDPTVGGPGAERGAGLDGEGGGADPSSQPTRSGAVVAATSLGDALAAYYAVAPSSEARSAPAAPAAAKGTWTHEELAARMTTLRAALAAPGTATDSVYVFLRELYGLSFVDEADLLGARAANWQALGAWQARLADSTQSAASRSLGAEAAVLLARAAFVEGRAGDAVTGEAADRALVEAWGAESARCEGLMLRAGLDAADGRYADALAVLAGGSAACTSPGYADDHATTVEVLTELGAEALARGGAPETAAVTTDAAKGAGAGEIRLHLGAPRPNPTRGSVSLLLSVPGAADVRADVFDVLGRAVRVLHDGRLAEGDHTLTVDASSLPAGTYLVRVTVQAPDAAPTRLLQRLTVVR